MKTLLSLTLLFVVLAATSCRDSQRRHPIDVTSDAGSLKHIYVALVAHEVTHGRFPASLEELVKEQALKPEEIQLRRLDGSLQSPDYFPDAKGGTSALLAFDRGDGISVIIQVDGSVRGADENQAGADQPAAALESKSGDNEQAAKDENQTSPLVGKWAGILTMGRPGPTQITTITINEDGTYHWLDIEIAPGKIDIEDPASYLPDDADLRHSSGWIDLKTGEERVSDADRKLSVKSVTWSVQEGELHWNVDMGNMGGQAMTYSRVR